MRKSPAMFTLALLATVATASARPALGPAQPVPGTAGITVRDVPLEHACLPTFHVYAQVKRGDDPALVAALTYPRLTGLDFDKDDSARSAASARRMKTWLDELQQRTSAATRTQQAIIADPASTPAQRAAAASRSARVLDHMADLLESVEVPASIRDIEETRDVYCDTLADHAYVLRDRADEARAAAAAGQ